MGALVAQITKMLAIKLLYPVFYKIVKQKAKKDEKLKDKYATKGAEYAFSTLQYMIVSVWGYTVLRKTKHLPWFMGGDAEMAASF